MEIDRIAEKLKFYLHRINQIEEYFEKLKLNGPGLSEKAFK